MNYGEIEGGDAIELVRDGDVEDVADVLEAVLQRMERMSDGEISTIASLLRGRRGIGSNGIDAMTDLLLSID